MKTIVIFSGGFHPFHPGHLATYKNLVDKFKDSHIFVASTDYTKERPFAFEDKKKLAVAAGVPADQFVKVKSPYQSHEITDNFNLDEDVLIFALSEKDSERLTLGKRKDGTPAYYQKYEDGMKMDPFVKHAYVYITPIVEFKINGKTISSASSIRDMYDDASEQEKLNIIKDLYPEGNAKEMKQIFDKTLNEEGTYASYKLTKNSAAQLSAWMQEIGVRDPVAEEDLHITTTYTDKDLTDSLPASKKMIVLNASSYALDMFGEAFVLRVDSPELHAVYDNAIRNGATSKYPKYHPHITLSYNAKINEEILPGLLPPEFDIILSHEIVEPIRENIQHQGNKWVIKSKTSGKNLGEFTSKKKAVKREKQINYFKHLDEANKKYEFETLGKADQRISTKLDTLLRFGLVPKNLYARAKRALINKKDSAKVSHLRDLLIAMLDQLLKLIEDNPILYHRLLRDVMTKAPLVGEQYVIDMMAEAPEDEQEQEPTEPKKTSFKVPAKVKANVEDGIDLRKEFERGGSATIVAIAKNLTKNDEVDKKTILRLNKSIKHNTPSKKNGWDDPDNPSNAYITWMMLGGDEAVDWIYDILNKDEE